MASVGREHGVQRIGVDGARSRFQFSPEKLVEGREGLGAVRKFGFIHREVANEGADFGAGGLSVHAPAVPTGKKGAFHEGVQSEAAERVAVGEAEEGVPVDLLGFDLPGVTVEEFDSAGGCGHAGKVLV